MGNPWFRLYHEFSTDPKVQMMSEADQRRLIMLMCLRCCNGDVTFHETEIAFHMRISVEDWAQTKAVFMEKKFIDKDCNLLNWDKRQFISDSSTVRVRKHREKMKRYMKQECNVSVTPPEQNRTDIKKNIKKKKSRLPENYEMEPRHLEYALSKGMAENVASDEFEAFCIHHRKKGGEFVSWYAAWQTWVRNHFKYEKQNRQNEPTKLRAITGNPYAD